MSGTKKKGLSFVSNRQRRKEGTFCASELAGIEPTPPAPKRAGYVLLDHSATVGICPVHVTTSEVYIADLFAGKTIVSYIQDDLSWLISIRFNYFWLMHQVILLSWVSEVLTSGRELCSYTSKKVVILDP